MSSTGSAQTADAPSCTAELRSTESAMAYRDIQLFQDEDGLWCWYDSVLGARSTGELWSLDSARRDIDLYRIQTFRAR